MKHHPLSGVYAAAVTPLTPTGSPDPEGLLELLNWLAERGAHGALLLGTTGEGPSFSTKERESILGTAIQIRAQKPGFKLLAGTGTPSLDETTHLTRRAFDLGFNGVVVLPPYYFRGASEEGLFQWFAQVIQKAVPDDGAFLGYHIPRVSGVPFSFELLHRLLDAFPGQFLGIKDSSGDRDHARSLGETFGEELFVLNGTDRLFSEALTYRAAGCITAMANIVSPELRRVWDAHLVGEQHAAAQADLDNARSVWEKFPPAPVLLKLLLAEYHGFPHWSARLPLLPFDEETTERALLAWQTRGQIA